MRKVMNPGGYSMGYYNAPSGVISDRATLTRRLVVNTLEDTREAGVVCYHLGSTC